MFYYLIRYQAGGARSISGLTILGIGFLWSVLAVAAPGHAAAAPATALAAGYTVNTFSSDFLANTVDISAQAQAGFKWHAWAFFGDKIITGKQTFNGDGSITLSGGRIATAAPASTPAKFIGTAFGGGAYIEGELKFDSDTVATGQVWPAFWAMGIEHLITNSGEDWQGMPPDTKHFIEVDFFEDDVPPDVMGRTYYGANMHDWYGIYKKTCPKNSFCDTKLPYAQVKRPYPDGIDLSQYHRYGFLWIPATTAHKGLGRFFFDGVQVGQDVTWSRFDNKQGVPDNQPWKFGILDKQHLVIVLNADVKPSMTVRSVNVWQASDKQNLRY